MAKKEKEVLETKKEKKEKELTPAQKRKLEEKKEKEKYEEIIDKLYDEIDELKKKKTKENKKEIDIEIREIKVKIKENKEARSNVGANNTFIGQVFAEMKLVRWPSFKEVVKYTIAVLVFVLFFAGFFYLINLLFGLFVTLIRGA